MRKYKIINAETFGPNDDCLRIDLLPPSDNSEYILLEKLRLIKERKTYLENLTKEHKEYASHPDALFPIFKPNEGEGYLNEIERPYCPSCDYKLTRMSRNLRISDEVWDTVNFCPNCGQRLKWNQYNDDI